MKEYLYKRTKIEFKDVEQSYQELLDKWLETWDNREIHDKLYSLYVKLQVLAVLLRSCLKYGFIENVNLKTRGRVCSLKDFCDYVIHRSSGEYEDNQHETSATKGLVVYLLLDTDKKPEVAFDIKDMLSKIGKEVYNLPDEVA